MSTTLPPRSEDDGTRLVPRRSGDHELTEDGATRARILDLIIERGPITARELAKHLDLTAAAVRRHLGTLETHGEITDYEGASHTVRGRGRPARHFVATDEGRGGAANPYSALASDALLQLATIAGDEAVQTFARNRFDTLAESYRPVVEAAGDDPLARAEALAAALTKDGFAATVRPVGDGGIALQLCQGHCPVQAVAENFPQLCEAETEAFSRLLGVHVQRLATLASGEHVCTTHVPLFIPPRRDSEGNS
ncbi:helix-turn-helix transcriptional regulator [Bowdeniella nasicola]|uniref:helix-turn-helix transcriptional regulator n=1 Tax=Bowdeniella nasicola TaxID=208480 RepID=UPI000A71E303|nr:helix-turn-helix domain-containing protein [Bowdeniella nasicola]